MEYSWIHGFTGRTRFDQSLISSRCHVYNREQTQMFCRFALFYEMSLFAWKLKLHTMSHMAIYMLIWHNSVLQFFYQQIIIQIFVIVWSIFKSNNWNLTEVNLTEMIIKVSRSFSFFLKLILHNKCQIKTEVIFVERYSISNDLIKRTIISNHKANTIWFRFSGRKIFTYMGILTPFKISKELSICYKSVDIPRIRTRNK